MPRRKKYPVGAAYRTCSTCGWTSARLTDPEWLAKKPIHELSERHKRGAPPAPIPSKTIWLKKP
jgi:hypothetical protein